MGLDLERRWAPDGACRNHRTEEFFAPGGLLSKKPSKAVQEQWDKAKEICYRCPVMYQCRRDTLGEEHGVWGGLDEYQRFLVRRALPRAAKHWPRNRRLTLGRILYRLRTRVDPDGDKTPRVTWSDIRTMTGIGPDLGQQLVDEYAAHLKALAEQRAAKGKIVDLPLEREVIPFPGIPGRRDMWVRHNRIIADGWYRGESVDGDRIFVEVQAGRHHAQKWVPAKDVKFHRSVPRYVVSDKERVA